MTGNVHYPRFASFGLHTPPIESCDSVGLSGLTSYEKARALSTADVNQQLKDFAAVVHAAGKEHLGLKVQFVRPGTWLRTLVVTGRAVAIGYRCERPWMKQFRGDLETGRFG
jgi:hypothetical protein